jgi:hypothetical protein
MFDWNSWKKKVQCSTIGYFTVNFPSTYMVLMSIFTPTFWALSRFFVHCFHVAIEQRLQIYENDPPHLWSYANIIILSTCTDLSRTYRKYGYILISNYHKEIYIHYCWML